MMKSAAVFLLLCLSSGQCQVLGDSGRGTDLSVLWDELQGVRQLVLSVRAEEVERRQVLRSLEIRVRDREEDAEQQRRSLDHLRDTGVQLCSDMRRSLEERSEEMSALQSRLNLSESSVENLWKKNTALAAELLFLQTRLRSSERTVEQLRRENEGLSLRLCSSETLLDELRRHSSASNNLTENSDQIDSYSEEVMNRLNFTELLLHQLNSRSAEQRIFLRDVEKRVDELKTQATDEVAVVNERLSDGERRRHEHLTRTTDLEEDVSELKNRLLHLETNHTEAELRVNICEEHLENVKTRQTVQSSMESRLNDSNSATTDLLRRVSVGEKQLDELKTRLSALSLSLNVTNDRLQQAAAHSSVGLKVAFSAALTDSGTVGPFDQETTLIFSKSISDVGGAYDTAAGVFTAPVTGIYFFSFTAADYLKGYMGLYLVMNEQPIIFNLKLNDHGGYTCTSGGVALRLDEGDRVRLTLPATYRLYDDSRNFSVFSGFLLFSL
ncbi:uncharacterized protein LOC131444393 isoform X1 [Solea solea]|uniref:uncharacterized protein LOC131444393 isoform X1 n=1 Tax=Solea solea TaxID=90069 RepID=UPI00272B1D73|nr:uncharacterized protein LOC131444393 isoform X1 [Solea solea]